MVRYLPVAFVLALTWLAAPAAAQVDFAPAVIVNDEAITNYDIDQRARLLTLTGAPQDGRLRGLAVEQLIDDRLKRTAGGRRTERPTPESVEAAVADYAASRNQTVAQLEAAMERAGVRRQTLEDALIADGAWREAVRARFGPRAEPSEAEIDQELELAAAGGLTEYRLSEIGLPFAARGEAATRALAERLVRELNAGGDFAAAARDHSASPTAPRGGDIGWVPESALPPGVAQALAGAPVGAVVGPAPVTGGLALLRVAERRTMETGAEGASVSVLAVRARAADRAAARARIAAILSGDPGCAAVETAAREAGLAAERGPATSPAALPPALRAAVAGRAAGQSTEAFVTDDGAVGFVVCERSDTATPEQRDEIRRRLRGQRLQRFAVSWLGELRDDAVIERR
jgi:peptidyl-prolyl cis-trans isomerase SurA